MIKINLLESVTDRQAGTVVAVERKVASPMSRLLLMSLAVAGLLLLYVAFDIISTQRAKANAEEELAQQKQIAVELEAMLKEQNELNLKIKNIDARIEAIKRLRSTQAGPSAVLEALKERIIMTPGLYLDSVEQKGDQLTISGNSPDESVVTQFGRSLEFSGGLFSNLNIETQRKDSPIQNASADPNAPKNQIVGFTIKCAYTPSKAGQAGSSGGSTTVQANSQNMPQPSAPAQTAANNPPANAPKPTGANPPQVAKKE